MSYAFTEDPQIEDLMNESSYDMWEGYDVNDEEWTSYYNEKDYDDESWEQLGGINADSI